MEAHKHNFKATTGPEPEIKNRTRCVSWASDREACKDNSVYRVQTPQYVTAEQFTALTNQVKSLVHTVKKNKKKQLQFEHCQELEVELKERKLNYFQPNALSISKPNTGSCWSMF